MIDLWDGHKVAYGGVERLSPDGRLPERTSIEELTKAFPPEMVNRVVDDTDVREVRSRLLPSRLTIYFVLALWIFRGRNRGYKQVMSRLVGALSDQGWAAELLGGLRSDAAGQVGAGQAHGWRRPDASSLARARTRVGAAPLHKLFDEVAGPVGADGAAGVFVRGLRVISVDGTTTHVPDTDTNDAAFGRAAFGRRSTVCAYPQVQWLAAAESGTGALVGAALGPSTVGVWTLMAELLPALGPGMLVLADGRVPPDSRYALTRSMLANGAHIMWRVAPPLIVDQGRTDSLADGTSLVKLHPAREADGDPIVLRCIQARVSTTQAGRETAAESGYELFYLVTDLLDVEEYPKLDLARAFPWRWDYKAVIGRYENDMGEDRPVLRSRDPEGVAQEMWALFAVYQAVHQRPGAVGIPPGMVSFS